jgi:two-component system chemotaxis sensor kinase CheA
VETVRVPISRIRRLGAGRAFVLRDQTIPLINLAESLRLEADEGTAAADDTCIVVVLADGERVGIEVDRPGERFDLMLKPMGGLLAGVPGVAGTSLLGDGGVLIVLDLPALLRFG